ncbi:FAD-dependent oxidoreductase, partial [Klebsiella pneumoniae]
APCLRQAEVLADRLCGAPGEGFVWQDAGTRLKVTGIELFSAGEQQAGEQDDIYTSWDPIDRHYRRLLLRDGRLRGVLLMGDCTAAAALTARLESDEPATVDWLFDPSSTQPQAAGIMTMTKPVLVLVGHGMVGHHFLEQCVSRNLHQQYRIVVFGEERYPAYDRVHLSEYFAGRSAESLSLAAGDFFIEHGIELRLGEAVATIDRDARLVRDAEGHEIHWDKLVLATGSYP